MHTLALEIITPLNECTGRLFRVPFQALHTWKGFPHSTNRAGVTCKTNNLYYLFISWSTLTDKYAYMKVYPLYWKWVYDTKSLKIYTLLFFTNNDYFVCLPLGHRLPIKFFFICILFVSYFLIHVTSHLHTMFILCIWLWCCIPCIPESNKVFESQSYGRQIMVCASANSRWVSNSDHKGH